MTTTTTLGLSDPQQPACSVCGKTAADGVHIHPHQEISINADASTPYSSALCEEHRKERVNLLHRDEEVDPPTQRVKPNWEEWILSELAGCGLRPVELRATFDRVPPQLLQHIPDRILQTMMKGRFTRPAFGLVGVSDTGKTMTLAALIKHVAQTQIPKEQWQPELDFHWRHHLLWVNWPSQVARFRLEGAEPDMEAREKLVRLWSTVRFLVLDDLGREGTSAGRSYLDDPCIRLLDYVLSERDANHRITYWTSNLGEPELVNLYGAATYRRLIRLNPPICTDGVPPQSS
jgi:hypothetical protein